MVDYYFPSSPGMIKCGHARNVYVKIADYETECEMHNQHIDALESEINALEKSLSKATIDRDQSQIDCEVWKARWVELDKYNRQLEVEVGRLRDELLGYVSIDSATVSAGV